MKKFFPGVVSLVSVVLILSACTQTMQAVKHARLKTNVRMSDTIFLDPEVLAKNRNVYVRVTNTSQVQEISFQDELVKALASKGYQITSSPAVAGYIIQANVLYMDRKTADITEDATLAGGFGGAIAGYALGGDDTGKAVGGLIGATVGAVGGAVVGTMVHVDTYMGVVDVQIKERVEGGVTGVMTTEATQGTGTTMKTTRKIKSKFQTYRTRIVATATQTNMDRKEAATVLSGVLAAQIGGLF